MLGISGLRGCVGESLTPELAARYAAAIGSWVASRVSHGRATLVIGRDSRPSGGMISRAVEAGLLATGCDVIQLGIVTTPTLALMAGQLGADGGVMITASHNPIQWNGVKVLRADGVAPPAEEAQSIIDRFHQNKFDYVGPTVAPSIREDDTGHRTHVDRVLANVDGEAIRRRRFRVVLDSVCGAGGPAGAMLLEALGVDLVHLNAEPTGLFPHMPEPIVEHLSDLCAAVPNEGAVVGFAQDPDADRLAIVDDTGRFIGEEYTLALGARQVLGRSAEADAVVVANLSSSRMIDDIAEAHGASVLRTPVGEANVVARMQEADAVVGGEGNGGVIWPPVVGVRDSLVAMALTLELLAGTDRPLSQVIGDFPRYEIVKQKVDISDELRGSFRDRLLEAFSDQSIDQQDGVRIDFADRWVHVRPSNTEPILRLIAEASTRDQAEALIQRASEAIGLK